MGAESAHLNTCRCFAANIWFLGSYCFLFTTVKTPNCMCFFNFYVYKTLANSKLVGCFFLSLIEYQLS